MKYRLELSISTDGDFDFLNGDKYFDVDFEEYGKTKVCGEGELESTLDGMFSQMKQRCNSMWGSKDALVETVRNLGWRTTCSGAPTHLLDNVADAGLATVCLMTGNQEIDLTVTSLAETTNTLELTDRELVTLTARLCEISEYSDGLTGVLSKLGKLGKLGVAEWDM